MPRVNRDLQRRMAARRERERRRPAGERRYQFPPSESVETVSDAEQDVFDRAPDMAPATPPGARARGGASATASPKGGGPNTTAGRATVRPFSAYRADYAYVTSDLRRIVVVVGLLLVVLIVLHFIVVR